MRRLAIAALLLAACLPAAAGKGAAPAGVDRDELVFVSQKILCDCGCHPQSVFDCACGRADEMWGMLGALVAETGGGEAALASYVAEHGEKVLVAPTARGFNLVAWLGPLAGLVLAVAAMVWILRRWKGREQEEPEPLPELDTEADAGYLARLNRDLENMR